MIGNEHFKAIPDLNVASDRRSIIPPDCPAIRRANIVTGYNKDGPVFRWAMDMTGLYHGCLLLFCEAIIPKVS